MLTSKSIVTKYLYKKSILDSGDQSELSYLLFLCILRPKCEALITSLKNTYLLYRSQLALIVQDNQAITISSYKTKGKLQTFFLVEDGEGEQKPNVSYATGSLHDPVQVSATLHYLHSHLLHRESTVQACGYRPANCGKTRHEKKTKRTTTGRLYITFHVKS